VAAVDADLREACGTEKSIEFAAARQSYDGHSRAVFESGPHFRAGHPSPVPSGKVAEQPPSVKIGVAVVECDERAALGTDNASEFTDTFFHIRGVVQYPERIHSVEVSIGEGE
jgi:hypothetical protein